MANLRVLMLGAFDLEYSRNYVVRAGLERTGFRVDYHVIPTSLRTLRRAIEVVRFFPQRGQYDIVFIPMGNQLSAPVYWLLSKLRNQRILLDYFLGIMDAREGRKTATSTFKAQLYRWVDQFNITRMVSITDTLAHRQAFIDLLGVSPLDMRVIPVGMKDNVFQPSPLPENTDTVLVQFVGNFLPVSGCDIILRAAARLKEHQSIRFQMIGGGKIFQELAELSRELDLPNLEFLGHIGHPEVVERMRGSSILLGVFGALYKTSYVIPNKVYEGLALGRPMITAEAPAVHEFFTPGEHLITVPPGNPQALADAILRLAQSPEERQRLGQAGAARVQQAYLPQHIGRQLAELIEELLKSHSG